MSLFDDVDLEILRNSNVERVMDAAEDLLSSRTDVCTCRDCRIDVVALALNSLPPRYLVSPRARVDRHRPAPELVQAAVYKAMVLVRECPNHP